jgi:hypothetical protein
MRARVRAVSFEPDRRFLFWVLASLVAGTLASGLMALMTATRMIGIL